MESKIFEIEKKLKLADLFYMQEQEKYALNISRLETEKNDQENKIKSLIDENCNFHNFILSLNENTEFQFSRNILSQILVKDEENKKRSMDYDHQIQGLFNELQENIKAVSKKNEEIENFRRKLIEENSAVINSALYLKSIYDEIENERNMFIEEKEKLFQQKSAYLEVDLKQREKLNLLNAKELELLK